MRLTEQQIGIISERPLNGTLDLFRDKLRDLPEFDDPGQEDVANLLGALVASPAAFSLPSPDGSDNAAVKLFAIQQHVRGGVVKLGQFRPLIRHVIDKSPDDTIWAAVFSLIDTLGPLPPPPSSIAPTFKRTPVKSSSSRLADSETRDIVERDLLDDNMDELPRSPVLLEIQESVPWPPMDASEPPQQYRPDELVEGVRSVLDRYSGLCSTCWNILGMLHAPLSKDLMSIELGTVGHVMSSDCRAHHTFVLRLVGFDWHSETRDERAISILRKHRYSGLQVLIQDSIYPPIELVNDPDIPNQPGYGRILDPTLIDPQLLKVWSERCTSLHGTKCRASLSHYLVESIGPAKLIDVQRNCIVTATSGMRYVALSYVWGQKNWLTTMTTNLQRLSDFAALLNEPNIPNTILDAMRAVRLLGERYLWVDSLCIIQDDEETKDVQLSQMWAIYAGACITIVAAQGLDASHSLRRLAGSTRSGELVQQFFKVGDNETVVERIFDLEPDYGQQHTWHTRAWTFQELLFSTRLLIFEKDSVRWDCPSSAWFEDVECQEVKGGSMYRRWQNSMAAGVPDLSAYGDMVSHFNRRMLTYPEDALFAIAGITSFLSRTFRDGFLCGLPELFFDIALLWQPLTAVRRRQPSTRSTSSGKSVYLPSWSWAGWQGELDSWVWNSGKDYSKNHGQDCCTSRETFQFLQWRSNDEPSYEGSRHIRSDFDAYKSCNGTIQQLPLGWTRHIYDESKDGLKPYMGPLRGRRYFYTHDSDATIETWYPLPLYDPGSKHIIRSPARYLITTTHGTTFLARGFRISNQQHRISLYDNNNQWVGILRLHSVEDGLSLEGGRCEVVAISLGQASNSRKHEPGLDEWELEERPATGPFYEFYNIMWITWDGRIAYRKGLGRVWKQAWDAASPKEISLVLA